MEERPRQGNGLRRGDQRIGGREKSRIAEAREEDTRVLGNDAGSQDWRAGRSTLRQKTVWMPRRFLKSS